MLPEKKEGKRDVPSLFTSHDCDNVFGDGGFFFLDCDPIHTHAVSLLLGPPRVFTWIILKPSLGSDVFKREGIMKIICMYTYIYMKKYFLI